MRRQHVPVGRRLVDHAGGGPAQADVVLSGTAMPDADRPLAALFEIAPDVPLMATGRSIVWNADLRRRHPLPAITNVLSRSL
jgi:hypothetical protein